MSNRQEWDRSLEDSVIAGKRHAQGLDDEVREDWEVRLRSAYEPIGEEHDANEIAGANHEQFEVLKRRRIHRAYNLDTIQHDEYLKPAPL